MKNKANKIIYSLLGLVVYVGFMVGLGFILDLFWKIQGYSAAIYWITTSVVCICVAFYVLLMLFGKKDSGVGALQLFFTIGLSILPIVVRVINLIPVAGKYISVILVFLLVVTYLFAMIGMGFYATDVNKNSDNRPGGREI